MSHFTTQGQRYRDGLVLDTFSPLDVNVPPPPAVPTTVDQIAPSHLSDGQTTWAFLFWDTGRQVTGKRHVRWTFGHADQWSTWNAVAWYGVVGNGPPQPIVSFDSYWVGQAAIDPTPIDGAASSFVNGGGAGQTAWPYEGNDHEVRTEWGPATVHAFDHLRRSVSDPELNFSSLTRLIYGDGDAGDVFDENDNAATSGTIVGAENVTSQDISFAQGEGAVVLASYVSPARHDFVIDLRKLLAEADLGKLLQSKVDPSPEDLVRLRLIAETLELVRGERPSPDVFSGLVDAARLMSQSELKRTIAQTKATLRRGEASLKSMEAIAAKAKSGGR